MKNVWIAHADMIDFQDDQIQKFLYTNKVIDDFLSANQSMGVSATKGMGKTFLIKMKRFQMQKTKDKSVMLLPLDRMVDVSAPIYLNKGQLSLLSSYDNWVDLWISIVSIYLLSLNNFSYILSDIDLEKLPPFVKKILFQKYIGIFDVLATVLINESKKNLRDTIRASAFLFNKVNEIKQSVCIFVDKLEEPFNRQIYTQSISKAAQGTTNQSVWAFAQVSFAEMTYRFLARNHIKFFYTLRQEALIGIELFSRESSKILDGLCKLSYTSTELYAMYKQYIENESDDNLFDASLKFKNPNQAFINTNFMPHRSGINEELWDYIYRHTLQRPRDIMEICNSLCRYLVHDRTLCNRTDGTKERMIRKWVNEHSTMFCRTYLYDVEPFMNNNENDFFVEGLLNVCRNLNSNIFIMDALKYACKQGNAEKCSGNCVTCTQIHYFSALYNIGLLGAIYVSQGEEDTYRCEINHIGKSVYEARKQTLHDGQLYFAHPGLSNIIRTETSRNMTAFGPSNLLIPRDDAIINKDIFNKIKHFALSRWGDQYTDTVFLSSTDRDMSTINEEVKAFLQSRGYKVHRFNNDDFPVDIQRKLGKRGQTHDHCIDVLLSNCRHVIYLFGGNFGGKYAGEDYQVYIDENPIIKMQPSISFMEYYIASVYNKNVRVYVDEKVDFSRGEYIENNKPENFKSKVVDKPQKVFKQLEYFNTLCNGTWYDKYNSLEHLKQFLDKHFPKIN